MIVPISAQYLRRWLLSSLHRDYGYYSLSYSWSQSHSEAHSWPRHHLISYSWKNTVSEPLRILRGSRASRAWRRNDYCSNLRDRH